MVRVGRREEIARLVDPEGSAIVFGGRRLGKSALLRHVQETRHDPARGFHVGYVDAQAIGDEATPPSRIWPEIARALPGVFKAGGEAATTARTATARIQSFLAEREDRRILVEIDEADRFVVADAGQGYAEFLSLQKLMTDSRRRFRIVLAGLSNVTRLVQSGNPPTQMISADPRRIGALVGPETGDAEALLVRPFAGMGVRFARREDVWRLISHANHFPILVQSYAERLVEMRAKALIEAAEGGAPCDPWTIGRDLVDAVLSDRKVANEVRRIFDITLQIDPRYRVVASSIALAPERDGLTVAEIRAAALEWWPLGFAEGGRHTLFNDLLEEMEGMGVLARTGSGRWRMRSSATMRQIGTREEIEDALLSYIGREPPAAFDPKSHRRALKARDGSPATSPMTFAQEREALLGATGIRLVLGPDEARPDLVGRALKEAAASLTGAARIRVVDATFATVDELREEIRDAGADATVQTVIAVGPDSPWTMAWLSEARRFKSVTKGGVGVVFAGGAAACAAFAADGRDGGPGVRTTMLEPWSTAFVDDAMRRSDVSPRPDAAKLAERLGGWNGPMSSLMAAVSAVRVPERNATRVEALAAEVAKAAVGESLGWIDLALAEVAAVEGSEAFSVEDLEIHLESVGGKGLAAERAAVYAAAAGLAETLPPKAGSASPRLRFSGWGLRRLGTAS